MEHIYDFTEEQLVEIITNALKEGYKLHLTEWMDEWERKEGCPSISYDLDEEDYEGYEDDIFSILPEETKHGCGELNIVKDDEYICFYHIERGDEYICCEALDLFCKWKSEEQLEKTNEDIYLHGLCHEWTKANYKENDKIIMLTEVDFETGKVFLIHCCLFRNNEYLDVRGSTNDLDKILDGFDYYDYEINEFDNLEIFIKAINDLGINFKED